MHSYIHTCLNVCIYNIHAYIKPIICIHAHNYVFHIISYCIVIYINIERYMCMHMHILYTHTYMIVWVFIHKISQFLLSDKLLKKLSGLKQLPVYVIYDCILAICAGLSWMFFWSLLDLLTLLQSVPGQQRASWFMARAHRSSPARFSSPKRALQSKRKYARSLQSQV